MKRNSKENKLSAPKFTLTNWIVILGSIIIFASWIVEKQLQSKWKEEKERLNRSQLVIDVTENRRANYEIALINEVQKDEKDELIIATCQQRLIRTYLDLLTWSKGRVSNDIDEYNRLIDSKREIDEQTRIAILKNDYTLISNYFELVFHVFNKTYMVLDNDFLTQVSIVNENEKWWTNIFMLLYIVGSILLGVSYVMGQLSNKGKG